MPTANVHEIKLLSTDDTYHGWSTIARLDSGELMVVCSGGRERHVCPYGKVQLFRSSDNGQSWSQPQVLVDGPIDDRDAGILHTSRGTIIVTWFTSLAWMRSLHDIEMGVNEPHLDKDERKRWSKFRDEMLDKSNVREELGEFCIRSTDGGKTWSKRINTLVSSPHGPTELQDGRLIHVGPRHDESYRNWGRGAAFSQMPISAAVSDDDGQSWEILREIPIPADMAERVHEPHVVEAADGRIIVHIRFHGADRGHDTLQSESFDGGKTWTEPRQLNVGGFPPHLLRLRDDRLLMSFGFRKPAYGNRTVVSSDNGQHWSEPMIISDDGAGGDLGYPSTAELEDGSLLTVWYEKLSDNPKAVLRQAHWSLEE